MIAIELDGSGEGVEIFVDEQGVDELISYLQFIKSKDDHMHLVSGGELNESLLNKENEKIKHAKLIFVKIDCRKERRKTCVEPLKSGK